MISSEVFVMMGWFDNLLAPLPEPVRPWVVPGLGALIGLWLLSKIWGSLSRAIRRRRPPTIHPNLQKYNVDRAALADQHRQVAQQIVATSTGSRLAGYRIVRQVEAVFVEGYTTPEDAILALKASAVERGGNAILNVQTQRTSAGKCSASGDAIQVAALLARPQPAPPQSPPPERPTKQITPRDE